VAEKPELFPATLIWDTALYIWYFSFLVHSRNSNSFFFSQWHHEIQTINLKVLLGESGYFQEIGRHSRF
jgi:hypothetical protein